MTGDGGLDPAPLALLLRAVILSHSDCAMSDSWESQPTCSDGEAILVATRLLFSGDEARKHTIAEVVFRELLWVIPRNRRFSITVDGRTVAVGF